MEKKSDDSNFISLGSSQGVAITSLDKYIQLRKLIKPDPILPPPSIDQSTSQKIANIQREQSKLCEDLNSERRRIETLKSTFLRAQCLSSSQFQTKLDQISNILLKSDNQTAKDVLSRIQSIKDEDNNHTPGTPRLTVNTSRINAIESQIEQAKMKNKSLEMDLEQATQTNIELKQKLEDMNQQISKLSATKKELKEKFKFVVATFKKRDASLKERVNELQSKLDQGNTQ